MTEDNRIRGLGSKEGLLALIVIIAAVAILLPVAIRTQSRNLLLNESGRMRNVFRALMLYEDQNDSMPAPNLTDVDTIDPNQLDYQSTLDPFVKSAAPAEGFPSDPGLENGEKSPFRMSFSYLQNFIRAGKIKTKTWAEARQDEHLGELANEWYGSVQAETPFHAKVAGRLMRINTDGSVYILQDRGGPKPLGDPQDLFVKR